MCRDCRATRLNGFYLTTITPDYEVIICQISPVRLVLLSYRIIHEQKRGGAAILKDITTIELQGANFRTAQRLSLLADNGTPAKASLIYGRNGSGKSTIAKAFKKLKGEAVPSVQAVSAFDIHNAAVTLTPDDHAHIFILDEDYVNTNVRVQADGLGSIVMLGEQAGLADLIVVATNELRTAEADRDQKKAVADEYHQA